VQPDAFLYQLSNSASGGIWFYLFSFLIVVIPAGVIAFLIQHYRRPQSSFNRFTNSHYDTRTGATRIGDALEDEEHQEVPSRFADDEPLVLT
jgi:hypothetical protein